MSRRSPAPTLFPYTTLFRSCAMLGAQLPELRKDVLLQSVPFRLQITEGGADKHAKRAGGACQDRKSTRLNSSHLVISYAVLCLKKKIPSASGALTCTYRSVP